MSPSLLRSFLLSCTLALVAHAQTPLQKAEALLDNGEFFAAERILEPLVKVKKPDAVVLWAMSRVRTGQSETQEAIKLAERALKLDSSQARFHAQLGAALNAHMGNVSPVEHGGLASRARKSYEKALSLDSRNALALQGLARYFWTVPPAEGGDLNKATQLAEQLRAVDAFKGEIELGAIYAVRKDHKTALQHFEAAIELNPKDVYARLSAGHALMRLDRLREARERYLEAQQLAPKNEMARVSLEAVEQAQAKRAAKP